MPEAAACPRPVRREDEAILIGYYGARNLGDELMLVCLHKWLTAQDLNITVFAEDAAQVRRLHNFAAIQNYPLLGQFSAVESLLRGKALPLLRKLASSDLVLAGGGDIIRDSIGSRAFFYQVEKLLLALLLRKPIYLVNVGITEPVTWYGKKILRWLLPRCRKIIVRESRSLDLCRRLGAGAVTLLAPDIVLKLPDLFPMKYRPPARPYVLMALHGNPDVYGQYRLDPDRLDALAHTLDTFVDLYCCDVKFLACQTGPGDADDHCFHRQILARMKHSDCGELLDWTVDPGRISEFFAGSRMVLAMRLHAAILAAAFGKVCILMPYDRKVEEFGKQASMVHVLHASMLDDPAETGQVVANAMQEDAYKYERPAEAQEWMQLSLDRCPTSDS